jgi:membrane-bound lytic murein transglycosylase C
MPSRREFLSFLSLVAFTSCSSYEKIKQGEIPQVILDEIPSTGIKELDQIFRQKLQKLFVEVYKKWGDKKTANEKEYVKYTDKYETRAIVNFDTGVIKVQTQVAKNPIKTLQNAITNTLLTPDDPKDVDILSDKNIKTTGEPFLYNLVLDQDKKPIRWAWRAQRYAKYLIKNNYEQSVIKRNTVHFVTFKMVKNHTKNQQQKYYKEVSLYAKRFKIEEALIYAIIETESSFNPYATSHIPAYGLMQIVPKTAGVDAWRFLYKKDGIPSKNYLYNANNNIQMGTAYLHILYNRYLNKISNKKSQEYCVIAAYNTGAGNVLRSFSKNQTSAFAKINSLSSMQVYRYLRVNLQHAEARNYVLKVTDKKKKYM